MKLYIFRTDATDDRGTPLGTGILLAQRRADIPRLLQEHFLRFRIFAQPKMRVIIQPCGTSREGVTPALGKPFGIMVSSDHLPERSVARLDARQHRLDQRRAWIARVLNGENISDVARSTGRGITTIHTHLQNICREANPARFVAGIQRDGTNNYKTPPLAYLRRHKADFGF